ncbi:MAG: hypothetical protein H9W80_10630 [Enterococcus sp.]|nr:hypothetical protein [Enterococcus sp.]
MRFEKTARKFTYEYIIKDENNKDKIIKFNLSKLDMDVKPEQINTVASAVEALFAGYKSDVLVTDTNRYFED